MTTPPQEQNLVSLVHPIAFETMKHGEEIRDAEKNNTETNPLKLLALKILHRNSTRNKNETITKNEVKQNPEKSAPCFTQKEPTFNAEIEQYTDLKSVPLFTNSRGKPLHCIHCSSWGKRSPWWYGVCAVSGASKTNKSKCDLIAYEEIIYG